jgi:hypothetical protein
MIPAVAPPESPLLEDSGTGEVGVEVEDARDAVFDALVVVAVAVTVGVEVGIEEDEDEGNSCASSKTREVADGAAEEREEYVSFILASVEFASRLSGRAQQMLIWSSSHQPSSLQITPEFLSSPLASLDDRLWDE